MRPGPAQMRAPDAASTAPPFAAAGRAKSHISGSVVLLLQRHGCSTERLCRWPDQALWKPLQQNESLALALQMHTCCCSTSSKQLRGSDGILAMIEMQCKPEWPLWICRAAPEKDLMETWLGFMQSPMFETNSWCSTVALSSLCAPEKTHQTVTKPNLSNMPPWHQRQLLKHANRLERLRISAPTWCGKSCSFRAGTAS